MHNFITNRSLHEHCKGIVMPNNENRQHRLPDSDCVSVLGSGSVPPCMARDDTGCYLAVPTGKSVSAVVERLVWLV